MKIQLHLSLLIFLCATHIAKSQYMVSTFAGHAPTYGDQDGVGTQAYFHYVNSLCYDTSGNLYVCDHTNYKIKKISTGGIVTTIAGSTQGFADGQGSAAKFDGLFGICIDSSQNLFVTDNNNSKIRKITPSGMVSTFAGSTQGYADGIGTAAQFSKPHGICIDSHGNLFVTETDNNIIRKITPTGIVTTYAGSGIFDYADGIGSLACFYMPFGITVDHLGNLYVTDYWNNCIRKVDTTTYVTTIAGSTGGWQASPGFVDGLGSQALFFHPTGLCVDSLLNVYVADYQNNAVRKIDPTGYVTTIAGVGWYGYLDGIATSARFNFLAGICLMPNGDFYLADEANHCIRKMTPLLATSSGNNTCLETSIKIYPNPSNGIFNLSTDAEIDISIRDILGRTVYENKMPKGIHKIDASSLVEGVYTVSVSDGKLTYQHSISIHK